MKSLKAAVLVLMMVPLAAIAGEREKRSAQVEATFAEVQKTLGVVPALVSEQSDENVAPFWEAMKALQLNPKTALNGKTKELIGLGVAAQVPCRYCVYGHSELAKLNGASQRELREAVAAAGLAREMSAIANGPAAEGKTMGPPAEQAELYKEIEKAFGTMPDFLKRYPAASLPSLWQQLKAVTMNGSSAVPVKTKLLISLAVVSQLPSAQCVKDYTSMARANGATEQEIQEAVAIAGFTREASTVLNGAMPDEAQWKKDVDAIVKFVSAPPAKRAAAR